MTRQCYVSIPFGIKYSEATGNIDFEWIYTQVISPAIEQAGLISTRSDDLSGGVILQGIFLQLLESDLMIADLTLDNANVVYELGLRHALRPSGTIVIMATGARLPFNLSQVPTVTYPLVNGRIPEGEELDFSKRLGHAIERAMGSETPDSPVYGLISDLAPPNRPSRGGLRGSPGTGSPVTRQQAIDTARSSVQKSEGRTVDIEPGVPVQVYLAELRRTGNRADILKFAEGLPNELAQKGPVVRETALALSKTGETRDLDLAIESVNDLVEREGADAETLGVLGRLLKTRYKKTEDKADLAKATKSYRRAFELDKSSVYFGTAALELMATSGDIAKEQNFLNEVRQALEEKYEDRPYDAWDYWDLASRLELAAYARDWRSAEKFAGLAMTNASDAWQHQVTLQQLKQLQGVMTENDDQLRLGTLIDTWNSLRAKS